MDGHTIKPNPVSGHSDCAFFVVVRTQNGPPGAFGLAVQHSLLVNLLEVRWLRPTTVPLRIQCAHCCLERLTTPLLGPEQNP